MITDMALFGVGDPKRSVNEPARIPGHGSVPAPIARAWLRKNLDPDDDDEPDDAAGDDTVPDDAPDDTVPREAAGVDDVVPDDHVPDEPVPNDALRDDAEPDETGPDEATQDADGDEAEPELAVPDEAADDAELDEAGADPAGPEATADGPAGGATARSRGAGQGTRARKPEAGSRVARVWLRRLYTSPDGRDLVGMDSRRRTFSGLLRRMLVLRDDVCTTPWCQAPIVHADHAHPARAGGVTGYGNGDGRCARCNQVKEAPGWSVRVIDDGLPGRNRPRRVEVTTPTGHPYRSVAPPLTGWGWEETPGPDIPRPADDQDLGAEHSSAPATPGMDHPTGSPPPEPATSRKPWCSAAADGTPAS
ncbi:hypothetical protein [Fodinibacter luteus]|uniref:hypothetical protein n=1 Tax=Fodinibacter luteus TaxID=552064 RepID=UPI0031EF89D5